jgi:hypothetical protein
MNEISCRSTSWPVFCVNVLDFGNSSGYLLVFGCFNLHFPDILCETTFHVLSFCLYIFFSLMTLRVFGPFFHQVGCFLIHFFKFICIYVLFFKTNLLKIFSTSLCFLFLLSWYYLSWGKIFNFIESPT